MEWVRKLRNWLVGPDLMEVADAIALGIRTEVWRRVEHRVGGLRLAEARGYIRVKTSQVVREAVQRAMQGNSSIAPARRSDLEHLVTEAVLRQAVLDLINARQIAAEAAPPLRKAA